MTGQRLSKKQLESAAEAELLKLCRSIKSDGRLSKGDIVKLGNWLETNKSCGLPAATYLYGVMERIVSDRRVSADEMKALHEAIDKVLSVQSWKATADSRKGTEKSVKSKKRGDRSKPEADQQSKPLRQKQDRDARRQERANRPRGFHSKVSGVTQRNGDGTDRQQIIRDHVRPGMELIVKPEPKNPHGDSAISLWVPAKSFGLFGTERQIGYLNTAVATDLAPYLDAGGWTRITVKEVTGGGDQNYGVNIFIEDGREVL